MAAMSAPNPRSTLRPPVMIAPNVSAPIAKRIASRISLSAFQHRERARGKIQAPYARRGLLHEFVLHDFWVLAERRASLDDRLGLALGFCHDCLLLDLGAIQLLVLGLHLLLGDLLGVY